MEKHPLIPCLAVLWGLRSVSARAERLRRLILDGTDPKQWLWATVEAPVVTAAAARHRKSDESSP